MTDIDVLLQEHRKFPPPDAFRRAAHVSNSALYEKAAKDSDAFWEVQANELEWFERWISVP